MDDLDHSMHISDCDWLSFCEESEECCLLQPSLARIDTTSLSDEEDLDYPVQTCKESTQIYTPTDEQRAKERGVEVRSKEGSAEVEDIVGQKPSAESDLKSEQEPELPIMEGADYVNCAGAKAEKRRWFVTVDTKPRLWVHSPLVNIKKKKKNKFWKEHDTQQPKSVILLDQVKNETVKAPDSETIQCHQEKYSEISLGSSQTEQITNLTNTTLTNPDNLYQFTKENTIQTTTDSPHLDGVVSDKSAEDEFFSSSSFDSENYLSAAESMEDPQHLNLTENMNADRGMHFSEGSLVCSAAPISCHDRDGSQAHVEPFHILPSAHHSADNTPDDNSTCNDGRGSKELFMSFHAPTSVFNSSGDRPESALPLLDVIADSPEAYARAMGNTRPLYAISAFWDEMEKLTINDILHIRMGRCMLPVEEICDTDELSGKNAGPSHNSADCGPPDSSVLDMSDTADSDYCTHLESKPDRSSSDFSTSDFEDEYWQFINSSRSSSPDLDGKSYNCAENEESLSSEETGTPVPSEDCMGQQRSRDSSLCDLQQIRKNKTIYNIHEFNSWDNLSHDWRSCEPQEEPLEMSEVLSCASVMSHTDEQYQISFPQVFDYLFTDNKEKHDAMSVSVYGLQEMSSVHDYTLCTPDADLPLMSVCEEPIPIFSCSHPTVRELTFPKPGCLFLGTNTTTMRDVSPIRVVSQSLIRSLDCKHSAGSYCFSQDLSSLFSLKKICFHDKGLDVWRHQAETEKKPVNATDSQVTVSEGGILMFKDSALRQIALEKNPIPTNYQSIFSTIKQSDMCLVCIAFASWVLRSSDPEAADTWKAALLATVSALSAIQYLRQYMKKKAPPQDDL